MALSRIRIEAQKARMEREKKEREEQGLTIGQASQIRQEARKEQEAKKAAGIPTSLPTFSELRASGSESLRNREILQSVSRNANRDPVTTQTPDDSEEQLRDANLKDLLWNSLKQGYYNSRYGEESYDRMMGVDNDADKYRDILAGDDYRFRTDNAFEQAVSGAMTQIGQMARQYTNPRSLGMATAAGGAALLAGQAGPQVLAPEELLTVPGAMALGFQTGSALSNFEIEGGLAYQEMLELGVSPETARVIGLAVGGGNAALEALQLDELMDGLKVAKKTGGMDNAAGVIWDVIKKRFPGVANNVVQEVGQEGVTITGAQLGSKLDKGEWAYDAGEVAGRLGDTALSSMLTFSALDVPGASMNVAAQLNANKQYSKIGSDYQSSAEDLVNEGLSFAPESEAYQTAQEVKTKMDAGQAVTDADLGRVVVANERTMQAEERLAQVNRPVETLEEVAAEAVQAERGVSVESDTSPTPIEMPAREAVSAKESVPYNVMATSNPVRQAAVAEQKKLGYGEEGMKLFREIAQSNSMDKTELMVRFDTPYQAGLTGLPMKDANLVNDFQIEAYNAGRMDYIARMAKDKQHKMGAVLSEDESGFEHTGAPKSLTQAERNFADFFMRKMGVKGSWDGKDGKAAYNAFYDSSTGGVTFAQDFGIDPKLMEKLGSEDFMKKVEKLEGERAESFIFYVAHEVATHVAMNRAPSEMRAFVNAMYNYKQGMETGENLARGKQTFYAKNKVALDTEGAIEEVVADAILDLYHGDAKAFMEAMYRIANGTDEQAKKGARTYKEMLSDFIKKLKAWARKLTGRENAEARANVEKSISELEQLRDMFEQAISTSMKAVETARQNPQSEQATGEIKNSIKSLATAAGIEASRDPATGKVVFKVDGKVVSKITPAHIREKSGLGGLITTANENGFISGMEAQIQYKAAADIMNMIINTQDPEMVWAWVGSSMFSAIKSNADGQYGTTVDFTTVCRKTQDMITAMSKSMMTLKRGLTKDEVTKLQAELIAEGSSVPCPVCYVFSRWAGIGSVLDNMYRWQNKYDGYSDAKVQKRIEELTEKLGKGKAKDLAKMLREQDEEYDNLSFEKEKLELEKKQLTSKKKKAVKENDAHTLADINNRIAEIDERRPRITARMNAIKNSVAPELAWLMQVRANPEYAKHGKVDANVLFNLDDAATFAEEFPLAWKYRTSRGPSAGKAILPYSDMRLGDMILGVDKTSADGNSLFANATGRFNEAQKAAVEKAIARTRAQNLIGGQRFQSTSDFRYDYALDYLMAFWEAQAIGSKMQTYTKIVEFGDMVAAVGGDFNLSVMPRNKGYITLPNGKNQLVFSNVTGINFEAAVRSNQMHDNGQLILVGINDQHILAALEDDQETRGAHIGFVIPYHASGASINEFIRVLVSNLGETYMAKSYQDYSDVQSDKERKNATADQKRRNDLRTKLLRGKDGGKNWEPTAQDLAFIRGESESIVGRPFAELRAIERKALRGDKAAIAEYESWTAGALWELYNKMWVEGGAEYGVRLNTAQAKSVMPHEYWNKTVTRDQAYINGFLFRSYCYNLGLTPRFSGAVVKGEKHGDFTDSKGYWKTLIDRPMYRNDGTYRDQQMVNMSRFNAEMLKADYAKANWDGYSVQEPDVMRATRAAEKFVANETGRAVDSGGKMKYSMKEGDSHAGENHQAGSRKYVDPASGKESARVREFYEEAERRGQTVRVFESANGKREGRRLGRFTEVTGASRSKIAAAMQQELSKLGIDAFVHEGDFELLGKSGEILSGGDAAVITHSVVGIKNDIDVEPKEAAGHEAYHFWKNSAMRGDYTDMVVDSLDWTSDAFKALYAHIDKKYFDGQYDMDNDDHFRLFNEELVADISGRLHNGEDLSAMLDNAQDVKVSWDELVAQNSGKQYSLKDSDYLSAVKRGDMETAQRMVAAFARENGYTPVKRYHQTAGGFTKFSTANPRAGLHDSETPNGIFFKDNDHDIGLEGKAQLQVYLKADNMLHFHNREEANKWYCDNVAGYATLQDEYNVALKPFLDELDEIEKKMFDSATTDDEYDALSEREETIIEEMREVEDSYRGQLRELLNEHFLNGTSGYDGIELDYDGHRWVNGKRENVHTYIVFDPAQVKSADPVTYDDNGDVIPLSKRFDIGNEDIRYSLKGEQAMRKEIKRIRTEGAKAGKSEAEIENDIMAVVGPEYGELIKTYGEIKRGERAAREIEVPRKTEEDRHVSQTIRTVLEAEATPDASVPTIQQLIAQGDFSYDVITDKAAMAGAEKILRTKGYETALAEWISDVKDGKVSKANTAIGWALYNQAANAGDLKTAMTILDGMIKHQRNAAQAVQATRILKKMSPDAQLYGVKRSVDNLKEELIEKYGKKAPDLEINEELARKLLKAKTDEERDATMRELYQDIGKQIPASFVDKWNAWRYLAMLGNPRTHVRNVVGNLGFAPVVVTKDLAATLIESMVGFVSRGKMGRTKAMPNPALLKAAWDDYANVASEISGSGKYNDAANKNQAIEDGRVIFKTKPLEKARKANSAALEMEDMWFAKPHYAFALAQYCKAHGVTADQLRRGKTLGNARAYAIKEAQKATYRDTNAFSETISELGRYHGDNAVKKGVSVVMEGILPFRKTPANILVRGLEYSPMGLVKGLTWDLAKVKKGDITAADAIDNIAAGLTGTGLLVFGLWAAAEGLIRGAGGDDEDEKKYEELQGHQSYALELPDGTSVTLDWLSPEALPVFIGVNLYEMARDNKGKSNLADILTAVSNVTEPLLEMSCLQSLNDLFDSVGYATSGGLSALPSALASAATSYLTQAFPTILGQAERSAQDVRMTTYTEKDNFLTSDLQYTLGKISAKIPGWDFNQIPYVDAWGRTESTGSRGENATNNFLNPAYMSEIETSAMEEELQRLYDVTGEKGVLPDRAEKKFTVNKEDKHLTAEEYVQYATEKGQMSYDLLTDLTSRHEYRAASDAEKVEIVDKAYEYATAVAKSKVSDYEPTGWVAKAIKAEKAVGMDETEYMLYELALSVVDQPNKNGEYGGTPTQEEKAAAIALRPDLSDDAVAFLWDTDDAYDLLDAGVDMRSYVEYVGTGGSVNAEKLIDIHSKGIGEETYFDFLDKLKEVDQPTESGKLGSYTQDEAKAAVAAIPDLSRAERAALWQSVNKSWKAKNNPWK